MTDLPRIDLEASEEPDDSPHTTFVSKRDESWESEDESGLNTRTMPTWSCIELDESNDSDEYASSDFRHTDKEIEHAFLMEKLVGRGGVGEVWSAVQMSLGRVVAVKRIRPDILEKPNSSERFIKHMVRRFHDEALITARLDHPNILPVYDLGQDNAGRPLLAMKLVRGEPWSRTIAKDLHNNLPDSDYYKKHLQIFLEMMQAVAFAHSRGIVHRDLKPSQVMLGEFGEILLIDWGLAMFIGDQQTNDSEDDMSMAIFNELPDASRVTNPSGTPALMAPEQTIRSARSISPMTDIYLLGGTLYYLLTGEYPHDASSKQESIKRASRGDVQVPDLRKPSRHVPNDLSAIAMRALQPKPKDRYQDVSEMITAVRLHLSGETSRLESLKLIQIAEDRYLEISDKDVILSSDGVFQQRRELCDLDEVYDKLNDAEIAVDKAFALWPENERIAPLKSQITAAMATIALNTGDLHLARRSAVSLEKSKLKQKVISKIDNADHTLKRQASVRKISLFAATFLVVALIITFIQFNISQNEARRLLEHEKNLAEISTENANTQTEIALRARADAIREKYFANITYARSEIRAGSYDSAKLLTLDIATDTNNLNWEWGHIMAGTSDARMTVQHSVDADAILHATFCQKGDCILVGDRTGTISVYDEFTGKLMNRSKVHDDGIWYLTTSPDHKRIMTSSFDHTAKILDFKSLEVVHDLEDQGDILRGMDLSSSGDTLVTGSNNGMITGWDVDSGEEVFNFYNERHKIYDVDFHPEKNQFLAAGWRYAYLRDGANGDLISTSEQHPENILSVDFSADGEYFVTACTDRNARIFKTETMELVRIIQNKSSWLHVAKYSPDGTMIATGDNDGVCRVWDSATGKKLHEFRTAPRVYHLDFSPNSKSIVTASNNSVEIFDLDHLVAGDGYFAVEQIDKSISHEDFHPAGNGHFAKTRVFSAPLEKTGAWNGYDKNYRYPDNKDKCTMFVHDESIYCVLSYYLDVQNEEGKSLRLDLSSYQVTLEENVSGKVLNRLDTSQNYVFARWIPDSDFFLTMTDEGKVQRWNSNNLNDIQEIGTVTPMPDTHYPKIPGAIAFSKDKNKFAIGRYTGSIEIYNTKNLKQISKFDPAMPESVMCMEFNSESNELAVGLISGKTEIYNIENNNRRISLKNHDNFVIHIAYSFDGKRILTTGHDDKVLLWDSASGRKIMTVFDLPSRDFLLGAGFSVDGRSVFGVTSNGKLLVAESVPWKKEELPGTSSTLTLAERVELYKRNKFTKSELPMDVITPSIEWDQIP